MLENFDYSCYKSTFKTFYIICLFESIFLFMLNDSILFWYNYHLKLLLGHGLFQDKMISKYHFFNSAVVIELTVFHWWSVQKCRQPPQVSTLVPLGGKKVVVWKKYQSRSPDGHLMPKIFQQFIILQLTFVFLSLKAIDYSFCC